MNSRASNLIKMLTGEASPEAAPETDSSFKKQLIPLLSVKKTDDS